MNAKSAISAINRAGMLLVFPLDNRSEPPSLWSAFYPKEKMRWEWDDDGDDRVSELWHLRAALSETGKAVYTKWYQGRATYFSLPVFRAMLRALNTGSEADSRTSLSEGARKLLSIMESESPLSTKELKRASQFHGRENERLYNRAMKELWSRLLVVAYGEVDDGAFPSLAVGATQSLFEELWSEAWQLDPSAAVRSLSEALPPGSLFLRHFLKIRKELETRPALRPAPSESRGASAGKTAARGIPSVIAFEDL